MSPRTWIISLGLSLLTGCSLVRSTAETSAVVVSSAAQVVGTSVKVAGTTLSTTAAVGSAAVSAGAATRAAAAATAGTIVLGASTLMHWLATAREEARRDELEHHAVTSLGLGRFQRADGRIYTAPDCFTPEGMPALLVQQRDGRLELRTARPAQDSAADGQVETQRCLVTQLSGATHGQ